MSASTIIAIGCLAVLVFDLLGATASRWLGFQYSRLVAGSYVIYTATSIVAARLGPAWLGIVAGAAVAFVEATIGWAISWWIGPGRPSAPISLSPARMFRIVVLVTMIGIVCGSVGTVVAALRR
jgi:hypothetical protein